MAERRMFAKTIIDSDAFLDMPLSTQAIYFHLSMRADDDGFINNPKKVQRMVGGSDDDLKLLIAKRFIIPFDSGIVVIKHWKIHNYIRNDRYRPTKYTEEKARLVEKENKAYTEIGNGKDILGIPNDNQCGTQDSIGKDSIDKANIYIAVVAHLNLRAGTKYRASGQATQRHINARIAEGYTLEDFKTVIDKKCAEWKGGEMEKFLRPETLFGTKFENYLNAPPVNRKGATGVEIAQTDTDELAGIL